MGGGTEQERAEILKGIIRDLHGGVEKSELKARFARLVSDVSGEEISRIEQQLIEEGMAASEIKELCDVHVEVFRESLERQGAPEVPPGHPVHTFRAENEAIGAVAEQLQAAIAELGAPPDATRFAEARTELGDLLEKLATVEKHYLRKENQLFPYLEKHGVSGPPQVMWSIHDDVRGLLKAVRHGIESGDAGPIAEGGTKLARTVTEMIYKEEKILFPMSLEALSEEEWLGVRRGEEEVGYALVTPGDEWKPRVEHAETAAAAEEVAAEEEERGERLRLNTGALTREEIDLLLTHLPLDVTYVDEDDEVRYYSGTPDRIFPRSPAIIGRKVQNCHPPDSVHIVNHILEAFRAGKRDTAAFWLELGGRFVHIRYFAVRDGNGTYRGTLEVTQDITHIRKIEGERRLLDWEEPRP